MRGVHAPRKTRRGGLEAAAVRPDRNRRSRALAAVPVPRVGETRGGDARLRPIRGGEPARTEKGSGESSLLPCRTAGCGRRCAARRRSVCQPDREHDFTREQWLRNWEARAGVLPGREKGREKRWCGCAAASRYDAAPGTTGSGRNAQRGMQRGHRGCTHIGVQRASVKAGDGNGCRPGVRKAEAPVRCTGENGTSRLKRLKRASYLETAVVGGPAEERRHRLPSRSGEPMPGDGDARQSALVLQARLLQARNGPSRVVSEDGTSTGPLHNRP